ncbi:hypothetical protein EXS53_01755 [Patescibacteria group bacterium]|nr:hypothetical protein [Patescibacteria group bacterium]
MPKDEDVKAAMHHSEAEHSIKLPKKDKSKKVWIIISIVLALALVGVGVYGFLKMRDYNKQINDLKAQVTTLQDGKKALEDAASAAAAAAAKAAVKASATNYLEVKELGYKLPLSEDIKDLQYFVDGTTTSFSTGSLQSKAYAADQSEPGMYCSIGFSPLGKVSRFANATDAGPTQQKALSGFVLGYSSPQADCSSNQTVITLQNAQRASFLKAFEKAEKI